jgi:hypothetical protein
MRTDSGSRYCSGSETASAPPAACLYRKLPLVIPAVDRTVEITRNLVRFRPVAGVEGANGDVVEVPVSAYRGVLRRNEMLSLPLGLRKLEHVVELLHADSAKTVRAYDSPSPGGTLRVQEDLARALHLPVLDETVDGVVSRPCEEAGSSLRTRAVLGEVGWDFDAAGPVPPGLAWRTDDGALTVYLDGRPEPEAAAVREPVILLAVLAALPFLAALAAVAPGLAGVLAVPLIGGAARSLRRVEMRRRLTVTRASVEYVRDVLFGRPERTRLALDDIGTVRRIRQRCSPTEILVIESATETILLAGLRPDQARWLEGFVVAAIAMAP